MACANCRDNLGAIPCMVCQGPPEWMTAPMLPREALKPAAPRLVILESPYKATPGRPDVVSNIQYARDALYDCLRRGEAPIAAHLLYTQVLDDLVDAQRELGIAAALAWGRVAAASVVYTDLGISYGMECGIARARAEGRPVEFRKLFNQPKTRAITRHPWR